jgi:hypothetical protein
LPGIGDALQFPLTFTRGDTLLKFAQMGYKICPDGTDDQGNKQEHEGQGCSQARLRIRTWRHFDRLAPSICPSFTPFFRAAEQNIDNPRFRTIEDRAEAIE